MTTAAQALADSRTRLLEAIGDPADLTLVRTPGNLGDELIYHGAMSTSRPRPWPDPEAVCTLAVSTAAERIGPRHRVSPWWSGVVVAVRTRVQTPRDSHRVLESGH